MMFSPDEVKAAIEALAGGDGKSALEILEKLLVAAASGGAGTEPPPAADAGATSSNAEVPPPAPGEEKPAEEMAALARGIAELFAGKTPGEALEAVRALKTSADTVNADRAVLEDSERRGLVAELVTLGVEYPATAWEDTNAEGAARKPVERLARETLSDMRKRVSLIKTTRAARGENAGGHAPPPAPTGAELNESKLSAEELSKANEITDPAKRKKFVELRLSRQTKRASA